MKPSFMFYLTSQLAFYLADNVCVLPNKAKLCVLPFKTQFCTHAPDTVIPGQDQGSHLNDGTMSAKTQFALPSEASFTFYLASPLAFT